MPDLKLAMLRIASNEPQTKSQSRKSLESHGPKTGDLFVFTDLRSGLMGWARHLLSF